VNGYIKVCASWVFRMWGTEALKKLEKPDYKTLGD